MGKIPILTDIFQMGWNHQPILNRGIHDYAAIVLAIVVASFIRIYTPRKLTCPLKNDGFEDVWSLFFSWNGSFQGRCWFSEGFSHWKCMVLCIEVFCINQGVQCSGDILFRIFCRVKECDFLDVESWKIIY